MHTFGFGSDHSVELLQRVAEAQSGVYYYISCEDDIARGFGDGESDMPVSAYRCGGGFMLGPSRVGDTFITEWALGTFGLGMCGVE